MDSLFTFFLIVHIVNGATGLIAGTINLIRRKGDPLHRRIGVVFVITMLLTGSSAIVLSLLHPNHFLLIVGIFTIYMVSTGYRYVRLRLSEVDNDPKALDWLLTGLMGITGVAFIAFGVWQLYAKVIFGIVYLVFGLIGLLFVSMDLKNYWGKAEHRNYWLLAHLQRIVGAYIAALTAFLVVNSESFPFAIPGYVYWLLPTVILAPLIVMWSRNYQVK
jgi:uncharacterized membrane protein